MCEREVQIKEKLQDAASLVMLLENDLHTQREDEIYPRVLGMVHNLISDSIKMMTD